MVEGWQRWWWLPLALAACGGRSISRNGSTLFESGGAPPAPSTAGVGGVAGAVGGRGGGGGVFGGSGGAGGEGAACSPPEYSQGVPTTPGCFTETDQGWLQAPCLCELWLKNTTHDSLAVTLTLTQSEASAATTTGVFDLSDNVEFDIQDPDAAFLSVWRSQFYQGLPIAVGNGTDGFTTVWPEAVSVTLGPVSVPACSFITATASMDGSQGTFGMHADFRDAMGTVVLTSDGTCFDPPHP